MSVAVPTFRAAILGGTRSFLPTSLSGLQLWVKADGTVWQDSARTTPAVSDADPVGAWDDLSPNGWHLTNATAAQRPTLKLAIQNGLPVLRFDGTNDVLFNVTAAALNIFRNKAGATAFAALLANDTATIRTWFWVPTATTAVQRFRAQVSVSGDVHALLGRRLDADSTQTLTTATSALGGFHTVTAQVQWSASDAFMWKNGTLIGTKTDFSTDGNTEDTASSSTDGIRVGARNGTNDMWNGDIGEIIVYDRTLTTVEQQQVEAYLRARWGTA